MNAEKPKRGRPKKFVDLELVEKLAHIQCTYGEIAATLGLSVDTLQRNKNFAAVYKKGAEGGRKIPVLARSDGEFSADFQIAQESDPLTIQLKRGPSKAEINAPTGFRLKIVS